jgi:hypothetical protein
MSQRELNGGTVVSISEIGSCPIGELSRNRSFTLDHQLNSKFAYKALHHFEISIS